MSKQKKARALRKEMNYGKTRKYSLVNKIVHRFIGKDNVERKVKSATILTDKERQEYQRLKREL